MTARNRRGRFAEMTNTNTKIPLATRLKDRRENIGMSQRALAVKVKISQPTIACYETGRRTPSVSTLMRLADAFGISLATLMRDVEVNQ